jgi:hypothetical protein
MRRLLANIMVSDGDTGGRSYLEIRREYSGIDSSNDGE